MTVIKESKVHVVSPNAADVNPGNGLGIASSSSTDSLAAVDNALRVAPRAPFTRRLRVRQHFEEEPIHVTKHLGKKKLRRYQNRSVLQTLVEDELENAENDLIEPYRSQFTALLENPKAMQLWNEFIHKPEDEQCKILQNFNKQRKEKRKLAQSSVDHSVGWIPSRVKRAIKKQRNLSIENIKNYEDGIIEFFTANPEKIYVNCPANSFDRLMIKAIARFHGLQFKTVRSEHECCKPSMEVFNVKNEWTPANCFLIDSVKKLKKC